MGVLHLDEKNLRIQYRQFGAANIRYFISTQPIAYIWTNPFS